MLQTNGIKNKQELISIKSDLRLIRCQSAQNIMDNVPSCCKNVGELSKILTMKNNQLYFKEIKYKNSKKMEVDSRQGYDKHENLERISIRVREQKQKIIHELAIKDNGKQKLKQQAALNFAKTLEVSNQQNQSSVLVFDFVGISEGKNKIAVCQKFRINNNSNIEDVEELTVCVKRIGLADSIKQTQNTQRLVRQIDNITQFRPLFESICLIRNQSQNKSINFYHFLKDLARDQWLLKLFQKRNIFELSLNMLRQHLKHSPYDSNKYIFYERERVFRNIDIFIHNDAKQKKFMTSELKQAQFWDKICFLYSKGPAFYYLLEYHLKYKQQDDLLNHFSNIMQGLPSKFAPNITLLNENQHYREFVMLLQCKYLDYCIQKKTRSQNWLIYYALRQSDLLISQNKSHQYQLKFLNQVALKIISKLMTHLMQNQQMQPIKKYMAQLFALGQYNKCISLLYEQGNITIIQFAIFLSILNEIDIKHSTILLYDQNATIKEFKKLFQSMLQLPKTIDMESYFLMITSFLPSLSEAENIKEYIINEVTNNQTFFKSVTDLVGFQTFITKFCLTTKDIPTILNQLIKKYDDYAFCLQLALSSCLDLSQLPRLMPKESNGKRKAQHRSTQIRNSIILYNVGNRFNQFENFNLNIMQGASRQFIQSKNERFNLLIQGCQILIKTNIDLFNIHEKRKQRYEQIAFINGIYKKISSSQVRKQMLEYLKMANPQTIKKWNDKIFIHANMLILTYNMLKTKTSIKNRQFEYIVDVLNSIFEQMSQSFNSTVRNLENLFDTQNLKRSLFIFIGDIIQSIFFLNEGKKKVIQRNKTILHHVCKEIHTFLTEIKTKQPQAKNLFEQLQKIMTQFNYF